MGDIEDFCLWEERMEDGTFVFQLGDGRVARCQEMAELEYSNCSISAGLADGVGSDPLYFSFQREGEEGTMIFMRPDEMLALVHSCCGALWGLQMRKMDALEWTEQIP